MIMEIANSIINKSGKFSIIIENGKFIVDDWQGATNKYPMEKIPVAAIADCIDWLSDQERDMLKKMVGITRYKRALAFAIKRVMGKAE